MRWREIKGAKGYFVSDTGLLKGLRGRPMRLAKNRKGYPVARIPNRDYSTSLHRTVAIAFVLNPEDKPEVNHKDGNKLNNDYKNLEWVTTKENINHAINSGLRTRKSNLQSNSIFTPLTVKIIKQALNAGFTGRDIAAYFRCHDSTISKINVGKHYPNISA